MASCGQGTWGRAFSQGSDGDGAARSSPGPLLTEVGGGRGGPRATGAGWNGAWGAEGSSASLCPVTGGQLRTPTRTQSPRTGLTAKELSDVPGTEGQV